MQKEVAQTLDGLIRMWCNLVALGGTLVTLAAVMLCLAPGDYLMAVVVFVALGSFFLGLYVAPKMIVQRWLRRLRVRVIYHRLDDGTFLKEEIRR